MPRTTTPVMLGGVAGSGAGVESEWLEPPLLMRRPQLGGSNPAHRGICLQAEAPAGIAVVDPDPRPLQLAARHQAALEPGRRGISGLPGRIRDGLVDISVGIGNRRTGSAELAFALEARFEQLRVRGAAIQPGQARMRARM